MGVSNSGSLYTAWIDIGLRGFDKIHSYMDNAVRAVQPALQRINGEFISARNTMLDFARAGSPVAFNTLGASIELLKARMGSIFTGTILSAAKSIQDLSWYIKNLDAGTKENIVSWTKWGLVGGTALLVASTIGSKIYWLGSQLLWMLPKAWEFTKWLSALAIANPAAALLTGVGVAAGVAWYRLDQMKAKMEETIAFKKRLQEQGLEAKDVMESKHGSELMAIQDPEKRKTRAKEIQKKLEDTSWETSKKLQKEENPVGAIGNIFTGEVDKLRSALLDARKEHAVVSKFAEEDNPTIKGEFPKKEDFSISSLKTSPYASSGARSLDSAYTNLNNMALGQDDIQRKILQEQIQANLQALQQASNTSTLVELVRRAAGL